MSADKLRKALAAGVEAQVVAAVKDVQEIASGGQVGLENVVGAWLVLLRDALWFQDGPGNLAELSLPEWTSESEASDAPGRDVVLVRRERKTGKLGVLVLAAVTEIAKRYPRQCWLQWGAFLPDRASLKQWPIRPTIITILLFDTSARVRGAAASCLAALLAGSHKILSTLDHTVMRRENHRFVSLAERLSNIGRELYPALAFALKSEPNPTSLAQIIKAASVLVTNVRPPTVPEDLVAQFIPDLWRLVMTARRSSMTARSASISCLVNLITNTGPTCPNVRRELAACNALRSTLEILRAAQTDPLAAELLALVASLSTACGDWLVQNWAELRTILEMYSDSRTCSDVLRLHAFRCVSHLCARGGQAVSVDIWRVVIEDFVLRALKDPFHSIREEALTCVSDTPQKTFRALDSSTMESLSSRTVLGLRDSIASVRAGATRAICQLCLSSEGHVSADSALESLSNVVESDTSSTVRSRALFALALVAEKSVSEEKACSHRSLDRAWQKCASLLHEKMALRPTVVRVLGQLACLAFASDYSELGQEAIQLLVGTTKDVSQSMKTRLSALLSLKSFLESPVAQEDMMDVIVGCCIGISSGLYGKESVRHRETCYQVLLLVTSCRHTPRVLDHIGTSAANLAVEELPLEQKASISDLLGQLLLKCLSSKDNLHAVSTFVETESPRKLHVLTATLMRPMGLPPLEVLLKESQTKGGLPATSVTDPSKSDAFSKWIACLSQRSMEELSSISSTLALLIGAPQENEAEHLVLPEAAKEQWR